MKITLHIGAHATDGDLLMRALMRDAAELGKAGTIVPGPSKYRNLMRDVVTRLKGAEANPETVDLLLDSILDRSEAGHVVLSNEAFMCGAGMIMAAGGYYARADRTAWLRNLFPGHEVRFALGIRNPVTQVASVFAHVSDRDFAGFMQGVDPMDLRWSRVIETIAAANPHSPLLVWCNEDTPLIWPDLLCALADCPSGTPMKGRLDLMATILLPEGLERLRAYLQKHPMSDPARWRRVAAAFLEKYARPEAVEQEIDLPGWTAGLIEAMTLEYEADLERIRQIPGVLFLSP